MCDAFAHKKQLRALKCKKIANWEDFVSLKMRTAIRCGFLECEEKVTAVWRVLIRHGDWYSTIPKKCHAGRLLYNSVILNLDEPN